MTPMITTIVVMKKMITLAVTKGEEIMIVGKVERIKKRERNKKKGRKKTKKKSNK